MATDRNETLAMVSDAEEDLIRPQDARAGSGARGAAAPLALAADVLKAVADGARSLADQLKDPGTAPAADMLRKTGEGLDKASDSLREQDVDVLVARSRDYVRDNPAVTIGAAAVAGFVLARMMRPGR
jgi:ElaB/YqjD/DUF883 family membrane-anchored ribosome-binding protein